MLEALSTTWNMTNVLEISPPAPASATEVISKMCSPRGPRTLHPPMSARAPLFSRFKDNDMSDLIISQVAPSAVVVWPVGGIKSQAGRKRHDLPDVVR